MKLSINKSVWEQQVAYLPVSRMSWEQLRATAVYEPARRVLAWGEMSLRSAKCVNTKSDALRDFRRDHGQ